MSTDSHAVAHAVRQLLIPLIKVALAPEETGASAWRQAVSERQSELRRLPGAASETAHALAAQWPHAIGQAEADAHVFEGTKTVSLTLPQTCPIDSDALLASDFDIDDVARRIRLSTATG